MSRAFDTIDRAKLLNIIRTIPSINNDDFRLIQFLLANTTLQVQFNGILTAPFKSNIGSPQGDGLSPILFAIYLDCLLYDLSRRSLHSKFQLPCK